MYEERYQEERTLRREVRPCFSEAKSHAKQHEGETLGCHDCIMQSSCQALIAKLEEASCSLAPPTHTTVPAQ